MTPLLDKACSLLAGLLFVSGVLPAYGQVAVQDDFSSSTPGSDVASPWQAAGGFWYAGDGQVCSQTDAFDTGLFLERLMDRAYEVSARFRVTGDYRGAGLLFNSASPRSTAYAQMIRLDDRQVLYGFLDAGSYQGSGSVEAPPGVLDDGWHTLRVRVDPAKKTYGFSLDGTTLREAVPLRYRSGFAGLQNSGGAACFDDFVLRAAPGTAPVSPISWPVSVAPGGADGVWVGSPTSGTVKRLSPSGAVLVTLSGEPLAPAALASFPDGGVAVLDTTSRRVYRFDAEGNLSAATDRVPAHPTDLTAWPDGTLAVSDASTGALSFFDAALRPLGTLKSPGQTRPTLLAASDSTLAFWDPGGGRFHVFQGQGTAWRQVAAFKAPLGPIRGLAMDDRALYAATRSGLARFSLRGEPRGTLSLEAMDDARPQRLAVAGGRLYAADFTGDRILLADTALTAPDLHAAFGKDGTLTLAWQSPHPAPGRVEVATREGRFARATEQTAARRHTFAFGGVTPATLYRVRYAPRLATLPADTALSPPVVAMAPPPDGKMQFVEIKGAVLLFANVVDTAGADTARPPMPTLPASETARILRQVEDAQRFFWINSGMRLHLRLDAFVVEEPLARDSLFGEESYYPPRSGVADTVLARRGADLDDYQALFYLAAVRDYDPATHQWNLRGRGGAFTNGLGWNNRYGRSWWEVTPREHRSGNNWLLVHEFHHQLDELFFLSGYPSYWFNHFAPHIGTAADFGEHFDGNAYLLRSWPPDRWFDLHTALLRFADDADGDGIPDDAPALPMDEARLGSSPAARDTDGDGLSDFDELALSNWIVEGGGETYGAPARFPDLTARDTDGDTLADPDDPYPLYPFLPAIRHVDGPEAFALLGRTDDARAPYTVRAAWSGDSLFIRFDAPADRRIRLLLDADADGWFIGRDNLAFGLYTADTLGARVDVFDAAVPDAWPRMDDSLSAGVRYTWRRLPGGAGYQLGLARNEALGLRLQPGERVGFDVGVSVSPPLNGKERDISIYEPNRFFDVVLQ